MREDDLERRVVSVAGRLLRLRALVPTMSERERDRLDQALARLDQALDAIDPAGSDPSVLDSLRSELVRRRIPAAQVARDLDVSRQALHALISGRSHLGPATAARLADWVDASAACPDA